MIFVPIETLAGVLSSIKQGNLDTMQPDKNNQTTNPIVRSAVACHHQGLELVKFFAPSRSVGFALDACLLLVLVGFAWISIHHITGNLPKFDSGVFTSSAFHLSEGKKLYLEIWDHKQPMIHLMNLTAFKALGAKMTSIWRLEQLFAVLGSVFFFLLMRRVYQNRLLAFATSLFWIFLAYHSHRLMDRGNLTTEYGAVFGILGTFFAILSYDAQKRLGLLYTAASGLFFSLAVFCKDPFIFSSIAWFILILIRPQLNLKGILTRALVFVAAAFIPLIVFGLYFAAQKTAGQWVDMFTYNLANMKYFGSKGSLIGRIFPATEGARKDIASTLVFLHVIAGLAVWGAFHNGFLASLGKWRALPLVSLAAFVFNMAGPAIQMKNYGHYNMQLAAPFLLLCGSGGAFLIYLTRQWKFARLTLVVLAPMLFFYADYLYISEIYRNTRAPFKSYKADAIAKYIRKNTQPDDTIWAPSSPGYYIVTNRLSPTKYHYVGGFLFLDTLKTTGIEKREGVRRDLKASPPIALILLKKWNANQEESEKKKLHLIDDEEIITWIETHYTPLNIEAENQFLALYDPENASPEAFQTIADSVLEETEETSEVDEKH